MNSIITFGIATYNSAKTIMAVLESTLQQNVVPTINIIDNESKDGTRELLDAMVKNKWFGETQITVKKAIQMSGGRSQNIPWTRYQMCKDVHTKYIFILDSDVLLPPFCIEPMIQMLEQDKELGAVSIRCEPLVEHVQFGCTLMKSEIAKNIKWKQSHENGIFKCECLHAFDDLQKLGLKAIYYPDSQARHLKFL